MERSKRGGPNRGQGRKPIKAGEESVIVCLRMSKAHRDRFNAMGGAKWVRSLLDKGATDE